jgi:hypothetical protein
MSIVLVGSTSGSVTLQEPAVAGTTVLDLPAVSGTVITTGTTGQVIASGALPIGSVLQVVNVNRTPNTATQGTTTGSWIDTYLAATITPKFSTSKILILVTNSLYIASGSSYPSILIGLKRAISGGATTTGIGSQGGLYLDNRSVGTLMGQQEFPTSLTYLDSPATTSAITYTMQYYFYRTGGGSGSGGDADSNIVTTNTPTITLMEIAA